MHSSESKLQQVSGMLAAGDPVPIFGSGAIVIVALHSPREKLWGSLLSLGQAGAVFCGIPLDGFDDFTVQLRGGEPANATTMFLPMHRIERIELDQRNGELPSMSERFEAKTAKRVDEFFAGEARR